MVKKSDFIFIGHILDSINAIETFSLNLTKKELSSNRLKQSAIVRELEIIGEATKNISQAIKKKNPEIQWAKIAGTRDKMIHHYFGLDLNIIWAIINEDLPLLKKQVMKIPQEDLK